MYNQLYQPYQAPHPLPPPGPAQGPPPNVQNRYFSCLPMESSGNQPQPHVYQFQQQVPPNQAYIGVEGNKRLKTELDSSESDMVPLHKYKNLQKTTKPIQQLKEESQQLKTVIENPSKLLLAYVNLLASNRTIREHNGVLDKQLQKQMGLLKEEVRKHETQVTELKNEIKNLTKTNETQQLDLETVQAELKAEKEKHKADQEEMIKMALNITENLEPKIKSLENQVECLQDEKKRIKIEHRNELNNALEERVAEVKKINDDKENLSKKLETAQPKFASDQENMISKLVAEKKRADTAESDVQKREQEIKDLKLNTEVLQAEKERNRKALKFYEKAEEDFRTFQSGISEQEQDSGDQEQKA
ncbi:unnamed protein product [Orchesella dallaii]|uniref:Uncharacterized protein n=1 Tax=Orchesella dallaii TaxID=48710 RepID=A0ABP1RHV8_9HEXA